MPIFTTRRLYWGLSPLARGNRVGVAVAQCIMGPIPVRTGQPQRSRRSPGSSRAYPRSHGATRARCRASTEFWGLSPLARGNPCQLPGLAQRFGPIPARTGQPLAGPFCGGRCWAYPRSHGATSPVATKLAAPMGLSPLARGNLPSRIRHKTRAGPIPARTGQPRSPILLGWRRWAYPRSHGATAMASWM